MSTLENSFLLRTQQFRTVAYGIALSIILPFIALVIYVNTAQMQFLSIDYPNWKYQQDFLGSHAGEHNDLIVLGDSRVMAGYDPLVANDISSRNLSVGGATAIEVYYILKKYLEHNTADNLILSLSPQHVQGMDVFWQRTVKFRFLSAQELKRVFTDDAATTAPYFADTQWPLIEYYRSYLPFAYRAELRNALWQSRYSVNKAAYALNKQHKGLQFQGIAERSDRIGREQKLSEIKAVPVLDIYLQKTAELAKANNIQIFWYTAPINTPTCEALQPNYVPSFDEYLDSIESRFGFTILSRIGCWDPKYFGDRGQHVNPRGSTRNTKAMVDLLQDKLDLRR